MLAEKTDRKDCTSCFCVVEFQCESKRTQLQAEGFSGHYSLLFLVLDFCYGTSLAFWSTKSPDSKGIILFSSSFTNSFVTFAPRYVYLSDSVKVTQSNSTRSDDRSGGSDGLVRRQGYRCSEV